MPAVLEITSDQARAAHRLRRRWPGAQVVSHERSWGVILEVRAGDRTVDALALTADGDVRPDADGRVAA